MSIPSQVRVGGILLHPTSLPGPYGIGDLGPAAEGFLAWAAAAGQGVWQLLPLGPTGAGNSPYSALSTFAGNTLLLSPELLVADRLLAVDELARAGGDDRGARIDFATVGPRKETLLRAAFECFERGSAPELRVAREAFEAEAVWLDDWSLYAALKAAHRGVSWTEWDRALRWREAAALDRARRDLAGEVAFHRFAQFLFFRQWERLRVLARERRIELVGDLPIYVPLDSCDVWAHRELFELDPEGRPRAVAGVPPDAFSDDGQLWGNPLYRWDVLEQRDFSWWIERLRWALRLTDRVRLDHFRGFEAFWRVPADAETAAGGSWIEGPGERLLEAVRRELGTGSLIAEDLGFITAAVHSLRRRFGLPGMKVLQFAFAEVDSDHLPHHHTADCVVYTGTHDNDTARGWFATASAEERRRARIYLGTSEETVEWDLIRAAYTSVARAAVVPIQDPLGLDSGARMNRPGRSAGNWVWRLRPEQLREAAPVERLRTLAMLSGRLPPPREESGAPQSSG